MRLPNRRWRWSTRRWRRCPTRAAGDSRRSGRCLGGHPSRQRCPAAPARGGRLSEALHDQQRAVAPAAVSATPATVLRRFSCLSRNRLPAGAADAVGHGPGHGRRPGPSQRQGDEGSIGPGMKLTRPPPAPRSSREPEGRSRIASPAAALRNATAGRWLPDRSAGAPLQARRWPGLTRHAPRARLGGLMLPLTGWRWRAW